MAKNKVMLFLLLLFYKSIFPQGAWEWQNPQPFGNNLTDICVVEPTTTFASGYSGTFAATIDDGETWTLKQLPFIDGHSQIFFLNPSEGWIFDYKYLLSTIDGGDNWEKLSISDPSNYYINNLKMFDNGVGYISLKPRTTYYKDLIHTPSKIYKSFDKGASWKQLILEPMGRVINMFFIDHLVGFVISEEFNLSAQSHCYLYRTIDGGNSWEKVSIPDSVYSSEIFFISADTGWIGAFKTSNGGLSWKNMFDKVLEDTSLLEDIYFSDNQNGWAITGNCIFNTTDGGENWSLQKQIEYALFEKVDFYNDAIGWIGGTGGLLYKTVDGGTNWNPNGNSVTYNELNDIDFVDQYSGWTVGMNGIILNTQNSGLTWQHQKSTIDNNLFAVDFLDENNGWAVGKDYILHTNDGGNNWEKQYYIDLEGGALCDVQFIDKNNGWAVGSKGFNPCGIILKTTSGGKSWDKLETKFPTFCSVSFSDKSHGWIGGYFSTIIATTDGGDTWNRQNLNEFADIYQLQFIDQNYGWASTIGDSFFFLTTDGGLNWETISLDRYSNLGIRFGIWRFFFLNKFEGWASAFLCGEFYRTTDGGKTFAQTGRIPVFRLNSFHFVNNELGWAVGRDGVIIRFHSDNSSNNTNMETQKICLGNFPNPFTQWTTVYCILTKQQHIVVKCFNELGQEIKTIYNGPGFKGFNYFGLNAIGLASGKYFIRAECEEFIQTSACVLVK